MATDTLQPIAPNVAAAPVAPPMTPQQFRDAPGNVSLTETVRPAGPGRIPTVELAYPSKPEEKYDDAIRTENPIVLKDLADTKGDPVAKNAVQVIGKNMRQFNDLTAGVDPNTPQGRLDVAQRFKNMNDPELARQNGYQTVKQNPKWGDAIMYFMAGDKATAMKFIIGGPLEEKVEYSRDTGRQLVKYVNSLGQIDRIIDAETGEIIPRDVYAKQGGSVSEYFQTLHGLTAKANQEKYTEKFQESNERNNQWSGTLKNTAPLYAEKLRIWQDLEKVGGLTKEQRQYYAGVAAGQASYARNLSEGQQLLDQFVRGNTSDFSKSDTDKLGAEIAALGKRNGKAGLTLNKDNTVTDASGKKYSNNELKNLQGTFSVSKNIEQSYSQKKEDLADQLQAGNLSNDQYKMLKAALDIDQAIELKNAEASKYGTPTFLRPTIAAGIVDQAHRAQVQAEIGLFNAQAMDRFEEWRDQQLKRAKRLNPSYVPEPNELENAFSKSDSYKELVSTFRERSKTILNTPYKEIEKPASNMGIGAVGPAQERTVERQVPQAASPSATGRAELTREELRARTLDAARKRVKEGNK